MDQPFWHEARGAGPLVAAAIHHGHDVREEVARHFALDEAARLREEDPFTGDWTSIAPTRIIVQRSRFEVDLNRPREKAVYRTPKDAWGLEVWKGGLPDEVAARSLAGYDAFYARMRELLEEIETESGRFVVLLAGEDAQAGHSCCQLGLRLLPQEPPTRDNREFDPQPFSVSAPQSRVASPCTKRQTELQRQRVL